MEIFQSIYGDEDGCQIYECPYQQDRERQRSRWDLSSRPRRIGAQVIGKAAQIDDGMMDIENGQQAKRNEDRKICSGNFGYQLLSLVTNEETKDTVMVDPGEHIRQNYRLYLERKGLKLKAILLTHAHFDHIMGIDVMEDLEIPVYVEEADLPMMMDGERICLLVICAEAILRGCSSVKRRTKA